MFYNQLRANILGDFTQQELKMHVKAVKYSDNLNNITKKSTGMNYLDYAKKHYLEYIPLSIFVNIVLDKLFNINGQIIKDKSLEEIEPLKIKSSKCKCKAKSLN